MYPNLNWIIATGKVMANLKLLRSTTIISFTPEIYLFQSKINILINIKLQFGIIKQWLLS